MPRKPTPTDDTEKAICPICLEELDGSLLRDPEASCPDCDGEGIGSELISKTEFLGATPFEQLLEWRDAWAAETGFLRDYHREKLKRLNALLRDKQASLAPSTGGESKSRPRKPRASS